MPSLSFQKFFGPPIVAKTKTHSIRGFSAKRFPIRSTLYMFTGLRTAHSRRLGHAIVESVRAITLEPDRGLYFPAAMESVTDEVELDVFAREDGFTGWGQLQEYWHRNRPGVRSFDGRVIFWGDTFRPVAGA